MQGGELEKFRSGVRKAKRIVLAAVSDCKHRLVRLLFSQN